MIIAPNARLVLLAPPDELVLGAGALLLSGARSPGPSAGPGCAIVPSARVADYWAMQMANCPGNAGARATDGENRNSLKGHVRVGSAKEGFSRNASQSAYKNQRRVACYCWSIAPLSCKRNHRPRTAALDAACSASS